MTSGNIAALRGMPVLAPKEAAQRRAVEERLIRVLSCFGYGEMRFPFLEKTELFRRSVGGATDIVEKEMYEFTDKSNNSVCLRPEGTAGLLRAGLQSGMLQGQKQRLWYLGPMFRYERPQSGRLRQFDQLGAEAIGFEGGGIDIEILMLIAEFWRALDLGENAPTLQLNILGDATVRKEYAKNLIAFFSKHVDSLDEDDKRRLTNSPMRLLDSKSPVTRNLLQEAPLMTDYLRDEDHSYMKELCDSLDDLGISYEINPRLVRGLDYYTGLVFEWVSTHLGAQNTLCAGGRYDTLLETLGGPSTPATGFAMGVDRLMLLLEHSETLVENISVKPQLMLISGVGNAKMLTFRHKIAEQLPDLRVECAFGTPSLKSALKRADKRGVPLVAFLGEEEDIQKKVVLRDMEGGNQQTLTWDAFYEILKT